MISLREFLFLKYGLMEAKKRDYKKEYRRYHSSKKAIKHRAARVKARRQFEKEGRVHKGDGMDIDHKKALSKGGTNGKRNLRVISKHKNRGKDNN